MADTTTTGNLSLTKPEIGSSGWGPKLNSVLDTLDTEFTSHVASYNIHTAAYDAHVGDTADIHGLLSAGTAAVQTDDSENIDFVHLSGIFTKVDGPVEFGGSTSTGIVLLRATSALVGIVDVTTNGTSLDSGDALDMFNSTSNNEALYIGADEPFAGVELTIGTAADGMHGGPDTHTEFVNGAGPSWERSDWFAYAGDIDWDQSSGGNPINTMMRRFEENPGIFNVAGEQQVIKIPVDTSNMSSWTTETINGETKYWLRIIFTGGAISTVPTFYALRVFERDTLRIKNGNIEYFGNAPRASIHISPSQVYSPYAVSGIDISAGASLTQWFGGLTFPPGVDTNADFSVVTPHDYDPTYGIGVWFGFMSESTDEQIRWVIRGSTPTAPEGTNLVLGDGSWDAFAEQSANVSSHSSSWFVSWLGVDALVFTGKGGNSEQLTKPGDLLMLRLLREGSHADDGGTSNCHIPGIWLTYRKMFG